jgi:DNA-binding beta-propeller fold protein YncE
VGVGTDWEGDTIVVNNGFGGGLYAVPANGGAERQIVKANPSKEERAIVWPDILPGGETVIATAWNVGSWDTAKIMAYSMKDGSSKLLIDGGSYARYSPTGHLLFLRGGNVMAAPFDPRTLKVGAATVVLPGVAYSTGEGSAQFAVSRNGNLVFVPGGPSEPMDELVWMTRDGKVSPVVPTRRRYGTVSIAPDMHSAAVTIESSTYDIWLLDLERDSLTRVSYGGDDADAMWTPDGNRLVWESSRTGPYTLFWRASDNSTPEEQLVRSEASMHFPAFTPDGSRMFYTRVGKTPDIYVLPLTTRKPEPVAATDFPEGQPAVSPDGRWLAYTSAESGRAEVYITSLPTPAAKWQVSIDGGERPKWMPDGTELVFDSGSKWFLAPIEFAARPRPGRPRMIFEGDYDPSYDVSRDGRIALIKNGPKPTTGQINVVLNWGEELKRRVPTR